MRLVNTRLQWVKMGTRDISEAKENQRIGGESHPRQSDAFEGNRTDAVWCSWGGSRQFVQSEMTIR